MLKPLTPAQISALASRPKAKRLAVENFLMTVDVHPDLQSARANLDADAELYGWNAATVASIAMGIDLSAK